MQGIEMIARVQEKILKQMLKLWKMLCTFITVLAHREVIYFDFTKPVRTKIHMIVFV